MYLPDKGEYEFDATTTIYSNFNAKFAFGPHGRPKVHPNHLSARKRRWLDGLCAVFFNGADKGRADHDGESMICTPRSGG